ncbi:MAG TPA: CHAT domain-containing protein [Thermoanaerobaculia bacterium]|nr:CHAT domain-containing protein [Thermoanaerobaculia bacterium]
MAQLEGERALSDARQLRRRAGPDRERCLEYFELAIDALQRAGDPLQSAQALQQLGEELVLAQRIDAAVVAYQEALDLARRLHRAGVAGRLLNSLGPLYQRRGEMDRAEEAYMAALLLAREDGSPDLELAVRLNQADLAYERHRWDGALTGFRWAYDEATRRRRPSEEARALIGLAAVHFSLGMPDRVLELAWSAQAAATKARRGDLVALAFDYEGRARQRQARYGEALVALNSGLEVAGKAGRPDRRALLLNTIGLVYTRLKLGEKARHAFEEAAGIYRDLGDAGPLVNLQANLSLLWLDLGRGEEAAKVARDSIQLALIRRDRNGEALGQLALGFALRHTGRRGEALEAANRAVALIEELRGEVSDLDSRASFLASKQIFYELQVDLLVADAAETGDARPLQAALESIERARARSLLDSLALGVGRIRAEAVPWSDGSSGLDTAISDRTLPMARPRSFGEIQGLLEDGETTLVFFWLGTERSYVLWLDMNHVRVAVLPGRSELSNRASRLHQLYALSDQRLYQGEAAVQALETSQLLLGPVLQRCSARRLAIVPADALHYLPFAALPDPTRAAGLPPEEVPPLVERFEVVVLPSASALFEIRNGTAARPGPRRILAAIGDPVTSVHDPRLAERLGGRPEAEVRAGGARSTAVESVAPATRARSEGPDLPPLRFAREEIDAILRWVPGDQAFSATGFEARRELVTSGQLGSYRILHFATHGRLDTERPDRSGLLLSTFDAQGRGRDGLLRALDLYGLSLPADLAVLSACRTALGREVSGEGLVGLTQGFLHAGTPRVMVSLWDVNDAATSELMKRFYRALLEQGLAPAAALRQAQNELRAVERWRAPFYWAAFTVHGEWRGADLLNQSAH